MNANLVMAAVVAVATTGLYGCGSQPFQSSNEVSAYGSGVGSQGYVSSYGVIDSIEPLASGSSGTGAIVGGIAGGLLGSQIGDGNGNTAATVAGAVGGAIVGDQIERRRSAGQYQVNIRLDNGSYQTVVQDSISDLRTGDRVRVEGGRVYRY